MTDFYEEISFTDRGGYFIIPVTIGSQTYDYIFDTGGYNTVTTDIMTKNNLPELMKVSVGSGNQIKSKITLSKVPQLKLGDISCTDVGVFNFDFDESPLIMCYTNGGLIGKGVIRQSVWQIGAVTCYSKCYLRSTFWCRGQDAASKSHHCANIHVSANALQAPRTVTTKTTKTLFRRQ